MENLSPAAPPHTIFRSHNTPPLCENLPIFKSFVKGHLSSEPLLICSSPPQHCVSTSLWTPASALGFCFPLGIMPSFWKTSKMQIIFLEMEESEENVFIRKINSRYKILVFKDLLLRTFYSHTCMRPHTHSCIDTSRRILSD